MTLASADGAPTPADDDIAGVRYGDLKAMDATITEQRALIDSLRADLAHIAEALDAVPAEPMTAHQLVVSHIAPAIAKLRTTQTLVDASAAELAKRASALDIRGAGAEITLGDGRKARLVGKRLPPGMLDGRHTGRTPPKHR